jgi:hypothetical protein
MDDAHDRGESSIELRGGWSPAASPGTRRATTVVGPREKDGRSWQIGTDPDVEWVTRGTVVGLTVTSAIPRIFDAYATVMVPELGEESDEHEKRVIRLLVDYSTDQGWWLGYLDTGASDIVFPDAPRVRMYSDWPYVLVKAGPQQALAWRAEPSPLHCRLPDLMFPTDRSWLISALWDDEWWCLGGSRELVDAFVREPGMEARRVDPDDDATPPGHVAR